MKLFFRKYVIAFIISAYVFSGCSSLAKAHFVQETTLNVISPAIPSLIEGVLTVSSVEAAKEGIAGLCLLLTGLTEMTPENSEFLCTASLAYTAYALLKEDINTDLAIQLLKIAKSYGMRALMLDDDFKEAFEKGGIVEAKKVIAGLDEDLVKPLMWTALPWGLLIKLTMSTETMAMQHFNVVEEMALAVYKLDPTYFYGLPDLFLMFRAAILPPMMGGTAEKVEKHYNAAMKTSKGGLLLTNIYYAQDYLAPYGKWDLALKKLNEVINTPHSKYPHLALFNEIAKMKAKIILKNTDKLFYGY